MGKVKEGLTINIYLMRTRILLIIFFAVFFTDCEKKEETSDFKGLTFTLFQESGMHSSLRLGENIVNYCEIIGYDSIIHTFFLNDRARERILKYPTSSFAVAVDGTIIYIANFIPGYSSTSCEQCIRIDPYSVDNKYRVELGYPESNLYTGDDPRNDERIIKLLKQDNKLINIDIKKEKSLVVKRKCSYFV